MASRQTIRHPTKNSVSRGRPPNQTENGETINRLLFLGSNLSEISEAKKKSLLRTSTSRNFENSSNEPEEHTAAIVDNQCSVWGKKLRPFSGGTLSETPLKVSRFVGNSFGYLRRMSIVSVAISTLRTTVGNRRWRGRTIARFVKIGVNCISCERGGQFAVALPIGFRLCKRQAVRKI